MDPLKPCLEVPDREVRFKAGEALARGNIFPLLALKGGKLRNARGLWKLIMALSQLSAKK